MNLPDAPEWRCYMRDPDGYLIEVGQYTQTALDWFNNIASQSRTKAVVYGFSDFPASQ